MTSMRPGKDAEAKLSVENAVYESDVFRKMHCELAWGDGGFEVLHVVMYPWAERAAPVFAADVVGFGGRVSLCIADVAPVTRDLSLPKSYVDALAPELERALGDGSTRRELPDWGRAILGPLCLCVGPKVGDDARADVDAFFRYAFKLHDANCALASAPELILPSDSSVALDAQVRFCERQLENVKTRRALERAFGVDLTDRYMRQVLFDVTPSTPRRAAVTRARRQRCIYYAPPRRRLAPRLAFLVQHLRDPITSRRWRRASARPCAPTASPRGRCSRSRRRARAGATPPSRARRRSDVDAERGRNTLRELRALAATPRVLARRPLGRRADAVRGGAVRGRTVVERGERAGERDAGERERGDDATGDDDERDGDDDERDDGDERNDGGEDTTDGDVGWNVDVCAGDE